MKITKDRLVFIIKEEHQKVKIINEVMNSAEYQRLVEIVGKEKADVIVEGFFDFDWVPGSEANKMRKTLNALEAAESEEELAAIFDQLPDDGTEFVQAINNAAESSSDPAAQDAVEDLTAATDNSPDTKPDDDQETADSDNEDSSVNHGEVISPEQAKERNEDSKKLARAYLDDFKDAGLTTRAVRPLDYLIRKYLIDFLKYKGIKTNKGIDASQELKPERSIAIAHKINTAKKEARKGMKFTGTDSKGRKMIYTVDGPAKDGKIPVTTTRDGEPDPLKYLPVSKLDDLNLEKIQESKNAVSSNIENIIKEELEKILKER